jgi:predicted PurR-regulated permease PerM
MSDDFKLHEQMRPASRFALIGLFVLASLYTLYFARALLLPVVLALLLSWSLAPIVLALKKLRLPAPWGAALVVGALVAAMGYGVVSLTGPAREWIDKAPDVLRQVEIKLRGVRQSVKEVTRIAEKAEEIAGQEDGTAENKVTQAPADLVGRTLSATASFLVSVVSTVILVFLLLAFGGPLTRQIVRMIPAEERRGAIKALRSFHTDIARYLFLLGLLSAGLGAAAGLAMYWLGMPTPVLWAVMVAVFNFVPYLGAVISLVVVTLVAILAIEPLSQALLVPAVVLVLTVFEGELLRAIVVGRYFTLNPIVVFLGILLSAWLWGVVGALIAVPLLVSLRIFLINIPALRPFGELISIGPKRRA